MKFHSGRINSNESTGRSFKGGEGILGTGENDEFVDNGFQGRTMELLKEGEIRAGRDGDVPFCGGGGPA